MLTLGYYSIGRHDLSSVVGVEVGGSLPNEAEIAG